ncbi:peptidase membrane zinc metallopeptidase [Caldalkalibacillus thermarum TA2.A1]|uniref:Zinc metallopeptidase n=1 Tax=Caldalkalibacillus thermarum (strain TA2.A1) TaxID=986075 RepID=F5L6Y5_CALTT|nr:zinc metallopeptidase [Caldalkalibacillus thermarum]EGL82920.1 peptidase membrane zinc metallopeptidase [Caldalkalibacillus thermarum TA2.A1]QZT35155.1 zinc metallopeptidase [Caldalkalibacillus thermarum TA2.A1]GGK28258.1 putative membrane protease YugP [Caldalkalibacillus thermarum]
MIFHPLDFLIFAAFGVAMWAQTQVQGKFQHYARIQASAGLTGAQVARYILDREGLQHVAVEQSPYGPLSDHYDPTVRKVRLSEPVYHGRSIAALAVAAHEVGHAIQHRARYPMLVLRHRLFPIANLGSRVAPFLLLAGFLLYITELIGLGIIFFSGAVLFQVVTLPVEFNASARAENKLLEMGLIRQEEVRGVKKVLRAAALTYVASTLIAVLQLLKFILIFRGRR